MSSSSSCRIHSWMTWGCQSCRARSDTARQIRSITFCNRVDRPEVHAVACRAMAFVGIDVGGTFTDFVVADGRSIRTHKVLSSRADPASAVVRGLAELGLRDPVIVHGCTLATNAFLERRGAKVTLLTTKGFEDLLEIGR